MIRREICKFDILTRMFSAGAEPQKKAEIRASEIRAQLRWWFRILGGFKNDTRLLNEQERYYFGGVGNVPIRGKLCVRVRTSAVLEQEVKDADELGAGLNTPLGYLLFPLRSNMGRGVYAGRAHFLPNSADVAAFELELLFDGMEEEWCNIRSLISVFGHLGSLGFRSRRCMGAIAFHGDGPMSLNQALVRFNASEQVLIRELSSGNATVDGCVNVLTNWLKDWRSYGSHRTRLNENGSGFRFAEKDHDAGIGDGDTVYRSAIGLPIIQQYSSGRNSKNEWEAVDAERFASPVILRPYRKEDGRYIPLVIFADLYKWSDGRKVQLYRRDALTKKKELYRSLCGSCELYEEMKKDSRLKNFL